MDENVRFIGVCNAGYYDIEFIQKVKKDLQTKAFVVAAGLDEFTPCEKFAYSVLHAIEKIQ